MWSPVHATSSASTTQSSSCTKAGQDSDQRCPVMRCKHAMCSSSDGWIYLFGGRKGSMPLKDLWRFHPVQNQWEEVIIRGSLKPPNLQEHTITSWNVSIPADLSSFICAPLFWLVVVYSCFASSVLTSPATVRQRERANLSRG